MPGTSRARRLARSGSPTTSFPTTRSPRPLSRGRASWPSFPAHALALTKRMLERSGDAEAALDFEATAQPLCFASDDFREGLEAFRAKRKPHFDPSAA